MISEDRKKHIFAVAEYLKLYAQNNKMNNTETEELYTLGLLHDIGYEFAQEKDYMIHNKIGGEILKKQGYKFWQEVYYHGEANSPYKSKYLDLLNWADMHIDSSGNYVSFDERLEEISNRYNVPINDLYSKAIVDELKSRGFK